MIKPRNLKPIKGGYDDSKVAFYPRMISQAELDAVEQQLSEAAAETVDKHQKSFEIKRQAIADWSTKLPEEIVTEKGVSKLVPLVKVFAGIPDAMNQFFAERTIENERTISAVYNAFVSLQAAEVDFL